MGAPATGILPCEGNLNQSDVRAANPTPAASSSSAKPLEMLDSLCPTSSLCSSVGCVHLQTLYLPVYYIFPISFSWCASEMRRLPFLYTSWYCIYYFFFFTFCNTSFLSEVRYVWKILLYIWYKICLIALKNLKKKKGVLPPLLPQWLIHYSGKIKVFTINYMSMSEIKHSWCFFKALQATETHEKKGATRLSTCVRLLNKDEGFQIILAFSQTKLTH